MTIKRLKSLWASRRLSLAALPVAAALLVLAALPAAAGDGSTSYNFLTVPSSSHVYGLGGRNVSLIDHDVNLVEQNPALLGSETDKQVSLNYMRYLGGSNFMGVHYGQGIGEHSAWTVGVQYYGYGSMEGYDITGVSTGSFSASDAVINVGYSRDIIGSPRLRGGINLKYIHSKYEDYGAGAIAVDAGISYYDPDHAFSVGLASRNMGGQFKAFNQEKESLPWDVQLGFTKGITGTPFRVSVTAYDLTNWDSPYYSIVNKNDPNSQLEKHDKFGSTLFRHLVLAGEFLPSNNMYIGIGYNYRTRTDMSTYQRNMLSGFSVAGGLRVRAFGFGIALAQPHSGATTFMLNISTSINELMR